MSTAEAPVPAAPARDRRQARHSPRTIALARRMYGDGDSWTPTQIVRYLEREGVQPVPTHGTVRRWVIPGVADEHREVNRRTQRARRDAARRPPSRQPPAPSDDPLVRLERMRTLRDAGMSYASLAVLVAVDYGLSLNDDLVRYVLQARRITPTVIGHLTGPEATS